MRQSLQVFALLAILSGTSVIAQTSRPATADEILVLHQAGLPQGELGLVLDRSGVPVVDAAELARLSEAGVPESVISRLRAASADAHRRKVTLDDVIRMSGSGVPEGAIIETIRSADAFEISSDQWLDLVRKRVSPTVLKALRDKGSAPRPPESRPAPLVLEDLARLHAQGITSDEVVRRIRASDSAFDVSVDQLITLSRQGVPREVLKEVWARRSPPAASGDASHADAATPVAATSRPLDARAASVGLHVESGGNFSLLVPHAFRTHRETRGANALVSFLLGDNDKTTGLAEAELSVFRYRSSTPDRLTESNLQAIASNFLASLQASYAKRKLSVSFGEKQPAKAAGQPALESRIVTTAADGTTHQGRILITYAEDQIFVVSTAVRTDRQEHHGPALERCLRSFGLLTRKPRPSTGTSDDEKLLGLAHAWRDAVTTRDWALYDSFFQTSGNPEKRREQFVALCDRFAAPGRRLILGPTAAGTTGGKVTYRLIPSEPPESFDVAWVRDGLSFALAE